MQCYENHVTVLAYCAAVTFTYLRLLRLVLRVCFFLFCKCLFQQYQNYQNHFSFDTVIVNTHRVSQKRNPGILAVT